jgi:hypothetical protein
LIEFAIVDVGLKGGVHLVEAALGGLDGRFEAFVFGQLLGRDAPQGIGAEGVIFPGGGYG